MVTKIMKRIDNRYELGAKHSELKKELRKGKIPTTIDVSDVVRFDEANGGESVSGSFADLIATEYPSRNILRSDRGPTSHSQGPWPFDQIEPERLEKFNVIGFIKASKSNLREHYYKSMLELSDVHNIISKIKGKNSGKYKIGESDLDKLCIIKESKKDLLDEVISNLEKVTKNLREVLPEESESKSLERISEISLNIGHSVNSYLGLLNVISSNIDKTFLPGEDENVKILDDFDKFASSLIKISIKSQKDPIKLSILSYLQTVYNEIRENPGKEARDTFKELVEFCSENIDDAKFSLEFEKKKMEFKQKILNSINEEKLKNFDDIQYKTLINKDLDHLAKTLADRSFDIVTDVARDAKNLVNKRWAKFNDEIISEKDIPALKAIKEIGIHLSNSLESSISLARGSYKYCSNLSEKKSLKGDNKKPSEEDRLSGIGLIVPAVTAADVMDAIQKYTADDGRFVRATFAYAVKKDGTVGQNAIRNGKKIPRNYDFVELEITDLGIEEELKARNIDKSDPHAAGKVLVDILKKGFENRKNNKATIKEISRVVDLLSDRLNLVRDYRAREFGQVFSGKLNFLLGDKSSSGIITLHERYKANVDMHGKQIKIDRFIIKGGQIYYQTEGAIKNGRNVNLKSSGKWIRASITEATAIMDSCLLQVKDARFSPSEELRGNNTKENQSTVVKEARVLYEKKWFFNKTKGDYAALIKGRKFRISNTILPATLDEAIYQAEKRVNALNVKFSELYSAFIATESGGLIEKQKLRVITDNQGNILIDKDTISEDDYERYLKPLIRGINGSSRITEEDKKKVGSIIIEDRQIIDIDDKYYQIPKEAIELVISKFQSKEHFIPVNSNSVSPTVEQQRSVRAFTSGAAAFILHQKQKSLVIGNENDRAEIALKVYEDPINSFFTAFKDFGGNKKKFLDEFIDRNQNLERKDLERIMFFLNDLDYENARAHGLRDDTLKNYGREEFESFISDIKHSVNIGLGNIPTIKVDPDIKDEIDQAISALAESDFNAKKAALNEYSAQLISINSISLDLIDRLKAYSLDYSRTCKDVLNYSKFGVLDAVKELLLENPQVKSIFHDINSGADDLISAVQGAVLMFREKNQSELSISEADPIMLAQLRTMETMLNILKDARQKRTEVSLDYLKDLMKEVARSVQTTFDSIEEKIISLSGNGDIDDIEDKQDIGARHKVIKYAEEQNKNSNIYQAAAAASFAASNLENDPLENLISIFNDSRAKYEAEIDNNLAKSIFENCTIKYDRSISVRAGDFEVKSLEIHKEALNAISTNGFEFFEKEVEKLLKDDSGKPDKNKLIKRTIYAQVLQNVRNNINQRNNHIALVSSLGILIQTLNDCYTSELFSPNTPENRKIFIEAAWNDLKAINPLLANNLFSMDPVCLDITKITDNKDEARAFVKAIYNNLKQTADGVELLKEIESSVLAATIKNSSFKSYITNSLESKARDVEAAKEDLLRTADEDDIENAKNKLSEAWGKGFDVMTKFLENAEFQKYVFDTAVKFGDGNRSKILNILSQYIYDEKDQQDVELEMPASGAIIKEQDRENLAKQIEESNGADSIRIMLDIGYSYEQITRFLMKALGEAKIKDDDEIKNSINAFAMEFRSSTIDENSDESFLDKTGFKWDKFLKIVCPNYQDRDAARIISVLELRAINYASYVGLEQKEREIDFKRIHDEVKKRENKILAEKAIVSTEKKGIDEDSAFLSLSTEEDVELRLKNTKAYQKYILESLKQDIKDAAKHEAQTCDSIIQNYKNRNSIKDKIPSLLKAEDISFITSKTNSILKVKKNITEQDQYERDSLIDELTAISTDSNILNDDKNGDSLKDWLNAVRKIIYKDHIFESGNKREALGIKYVMDTYMSIFKEVASDPIKGAAKAALLNRASGESVGQSKANALYAAIYAEISQKFISRNLANINFEESCNKFDQDFQKFIEIHNKRISQWSLLCLAQEDYNKGGKSDVFEALMKAKKSYHEIEAEFDKSLLNLKDSFKLRQKAQEKTFAIFSEESKDLSSLQGFSCGYSGEEFKEEVVVKPTIDKINKITEDSKEKIDNILETAKFYDNKTPGNLHDKNPFDEAQITDLITSLEFKDINRTGVAKVIVPAEPKIKAMSKDEGEKLNIIHAKISVEKGKSTLASQSLIQNTPSATVKTSDWLQLVSVQKVQKVN